MDSKITGGLVKGIKAPHSEYLEYITLDKPIQLNKDEVIGSVRFLDYEMNGKKDPVLVEKDDFDPSQFF